MLRNHNSGDFVKIISKYFVKIKANFNWKGSVWAFRKCLVTYIHLVKQFFCTYQACTECPEEKKKSHAILRPLEGFAASLERQLCRETRNESQHSSSSLLSASVESIQTKALEGCPIKTKAASASSAISSGFIVFVLFGVLTCL